MKSSQISWPKFASLRPIRKVLSFSREKLGPSVTVPFRMLNSGVVKRISGRSRGGPPAAPPPPPPPLFLDQTEARRAEKNFGDRKVWIRH